MRFAISHNSAAAALDPLELYASGIDGSDYVARACPLIRAAVPQIGDLLDLGAGGGQIGAALREQGREWRAVEPSPTMQIRLEALDPGPHLVRGGWKEVSLPMKCADTVLAANMPAPLTEPEAFLARCRQWARKAVVWVVPAQHGPRGICLAGCLPREWHGEDETPGVDIVLRGLARNDRPGIAAETQWTFNLDVPDLSQTSDYLASRLGWASKDRRRSELVAHLTKQAMSIPGGFRLSVPRKSAILVWRMNP